MIKFGDVNILEKKYFMWFIQNYKFDPNKYDI